MADNVQTYTTDEKLVDGIRSGDQDSFHILYDRYAGALFGLLCKITEDEKLSESLLHVCFLNIWQNIGEFDPGRQRFFTWMVGIGRKIATEAVLEKKNGNRIQDLENYVKNNVVTKSESRNKNVLLPLLLVKGYTCQQVADAIGISTEELKLMIRTEINQLRRISE